MTECASFNDHSTPSLSLDSTLQDLSLWQQQLDLGSPGQAAVTLFEQHSRLPGIILTQQQEYIGLLSRRQFFEQMSRPYSLELFSKRPLTLLWEFVQTEALMLPATSAISEAAQIALSRSIDLAYDPIVVISQAGYHVLGMQPLLVAHTQLHELLIKALQHSETQLSQQAGNLQRVLDDLKRTQNHMIQSEKMSALGQLVAGVAHEINNPINFIHGNLVPIDSYAQDLLTVVQAYQTHYPNPPKALQDILEEVELDFVCEDLEKLLRSMKVGTDRIREIVLSLRNFSRLDEAEFKAVDLHEGLDSTLLILQHRLKAKPESPAIKIVKEYGHLPLVECYPGQINQVFMNLLANAIDVLEDAAQQRAKGNLAQSGEIWISTQLLATNWVQITIADTGLGMPEGVRSQIFNPFFTTKPLGKGTGLGLSISYQIVTEKHDGRMWCNSTPGEGTEFVIEVPIHRREPTPP